MTEQQFLELVERTLDAIEDALDAGGVDVQCDRSGHLLQLEFDDGSRIVVNAQTPLRELWVAARGGGVHFRRDGERWLDTRSGSEIWDGLSKWVGEQSGAPVVLRPRR